MTDVMCAKVPVAQRGSPHSLAQCSKDVQQKVLAPVGNATDKDLRTVCNTFCHPSARGCRSVASQGRSVNSSQRQSSSFVQTVLAVV